MDIYSLQSVRGNVGDLFFLEKPASRLVSSHRWLESVGPTHNVDARPFRSQPEVAYVKYRPPFDFTFDFVLEQGIGLQ